MFGYSTELRSTTQVRLRELVCFVEYSESTSISGVLTDPCLDQMESNIIHLRRVPLLSMSLRGRWIESAN